MADGSIIIDTKVDNSGAEKGLKSLGGIAGKALGGVKTAAVAMATGIGVATGAVVALTKASIEQYAQYEQLTGGVETLFKDSASQVMEYADNAYKTAGMSANEYMSTITGFSASLLQGLGGNTKKAAEIGNMAVVDMSDNANKMGTSLESIQNAYQGFAKQNYTMLDNLKLGYGGTKSEMERLLADAEKLSGVHYEISNFSDVINAIHVIQEEMGITGTTAKEAMSTIEGSLNMTKAAWSNLLTGMADDKADFGKLIDNLVESVSAFGQNILPRIQIVLNGIGELISQLAPVIAEKIPELVATILPQLITAGIDIVNSLITGIQQNLPTLASSAVEILSSMTTALLSVLPQVLAIGMQAIAYLAEGIGQQLPTLIPLAVQCIVSLVQGLVDNMPLLLNAGLDLLNGLAQGIINALPQLIAALPQIIQEILNFFTTEAPNVLNAGLEIILALINGIVQALPQLIAMLPQIIDNMVTFFTTNMPQIIQVGIQVLLALIDGLIQALPQLIAMLPQIIIAINNGLLAHLPELINAGVQIIIALAQGLSQAIPQLIGAVPQIISALWNAFTEVNWGEVGSNILNGIGAGIKGAITGMVEVGIQACKTLKDSVLSFFDIHSPSRVMRDEVGKNIVAGIEVGMEQQSGSLLNTAQNICDQLVNQFGNVLNEKSAEDVVNRFKSVSGVLGNLTNELNNAQSRVDWANGLTLDDNKWYYDAKTRLEDVKYQLEQLSDQISDTEDKNAKKSLQEQQKALQKKQKLIQKEFDYYKEAAQEEINERKAATKEELRIAKEKYSRLEEFSKALTTAIKNQINEQKSATLNGIDAELSKLEERYNKESDKIDANSEKKKARIQSEIDKLDEEKEAEDRLKEVQEANNNIAVLQAKMNNTASEADKKAYALKIKNVKAALEEKRKEWDRTDEKNALKEEQEEIEERANRNKERLKAEYEEEKENLKKKKEATEEYYNKLLETDSINAQARYMILTRSNDELVALLQSYNPLWQDAGQSLADSLINGLNSKRQDMANVVAEMTSFRNGVEVNLDGYATGTSYNRSAGLYNVDERGFELSTGNNPVAYVSRGAGILNHMQSLQAIKKEVKAQVGTFADKLRSAVMMDQYRMSQLAFAGVNNSYGGNIDNSTSYGGHLLNVEHMEIRSQSDIESLAHELESYKQRKKK